MNQMACIAHDLPPAALAQECFRDGGDVGSNPYPAGCKEHAEFVSTLNKLQALELQNEQAELEAGV